MKRYAFFIALFALGFVCLAQAQVPASTDVVLSLAHAGVGVDAFYNGTTVHASGAVPAGSDVVVVVSGQPEELHLKRKGKAAGLFWMNVGDLTISNVPEVYMVYSNDGASSLLESAAMPFSLAALRNRVEISTEEKEEKNRDLLFKEFIKLQKEQSVYAVSSGAISLEKNGHYNLELTLPPRIKQGDYIVTSYAIEDEQIIGTATGNLTIALTGFPEWLSKMAFQKALIYGLLSVLIALAAGLLMGLLFKDSGDSAH